MEMSEGQTTRWMTVQQCALYLGLTERAIYNHIHRDSLPYHKFGSRVFFDASEIDNTIRGLKRKKKLN